MTGKADFSEEEWDAVLEGPTSAGVLVMSAERGGTFRESFAMAKVFGEARKQSGSSELLDQIAAHKPEVARPKAHSPEELREAELTRIREGVAAVRAKASEDELAEYRGFVNEVARRVAEAKEERGQDGPVSEAERQALADVESALA